MGRRSARSASAHDQRLGVVRDPIFKGDTESVGDPVDVGVVADNVNDVQDVGIREPDVRECLLVGGRHLARCAGELVSERQHGQTFLAQSSGVIVVLDGRQHCVVFEEPTQTASVVDRSVFAIVDSADDEGDHFAFYLAQCLGPGHGVAIEAEMRRHA